LFTAPLLLPAIVLGLAILLVFVRLQLLGTFPGLIVAHLIVATPYVIRIMTTALGTLPPSVEEAATMLGASPLVVFRRITLPLMTPGLIASAALSFLLSFDEVVISLFITGPRLTTLPVEIFNYVESQTDPMTASISVVLVAATLLIIILIERTLGLSQTMGK
ncbi:MAG: ABC transporter permease subunit, partial [Phyllobacterium sp.]|uniref:ABC transporter permease n=1 Tax=Phyllobacterium sp. TaxID=1871046 RepID=UPI0030F1913F